MPTGLFSSKQREVLNAFPESVSDEARDQYFTFSDEDRRFAARFGDTGIDVALMLGSLRMLGFVPADLPVSGSLVEFVSAQLKSDEQDRVDAVMLPERSRRHRVAVAVGHAGWRRHSQSDLMLLDDWLLERAMEHDKPAVLFGLTLDWLRVERVVRPGITVIERAVAKAREQAWDETFDRLSLAYLMSRFKGLIDCLISDTV